MLKRYLTGPLFLSHWKSDESVSGDFIVPASPAPLAYRSSKVSLPLGNGKIGDFGDSGRYEGPQTTVRGACSPPVPTEIETTKTAELTAETSTKAQAKASINPVLMDAGTLWSTSVESLNHVDGPSITTDHTTRLMQQQQLRQVERRLRRSLDISTILGITAVETAQLFGARQVSLLSYQAETERWKQAAQYCKNQSLAWQQQFDISQAEFPLLTRQLVQGRSLHLPVLQEDESSSTSLGNEIAQWLASWPGNWLLVPIKIQTPIAYELNSSDNLTSSSSFALPFTMPLGLNSPKANMPKLRSSTEANVACFASNAESVLSDEPSDLTAGDDHWGIMALALDESSVWQRCAIAAAESIVLEFEQAIQQSLQYQELIFANQELLKLALSDGLTCLANRRRFDEHLADEWQRLARDRQPLSLILCDLDHFKRYNDSFGHPAGDRCLIRVARALLNGPQRPADLVARYGGEEFAIILPNTDTHGAWRIAQKIHDNIRALKIAHAPKNEEPYVTVTMGVSTVMPGHDTTPQMLVQASDLALYHAKQQGRNRTYVNAHYVVQETDAISDPQLELMKADSQESPE
ncbi:MAG: diguanylate cyclase [Cyanobacteria bacterium J06597_16]